MMNDTAIFYLYSRFSESEYVNTQIYFRCREALKKKSVDGLCDSITYNTVNNGVKTPHTIEAFEVEARLKSIGLYQLVISMINGITTEFYEILDELVVGSFGWAEVENEIRIRAIEAIDKRCMEPLMKEVNMEWRNGVCTLTSEEVIEKLKENGIWQFIAAEIIKRKKK